MNKQDKNLRETRDIAQFIGTDGWKLVRERLVEKLIEFDSISSVPKENRTLEDIANDIIQREAVVAIVLDWIREIEGERGANEYNIQAFKQDRIRTYIKNIDEKQE